MRGIVGTAAFIVVVGGCAGAPVQHGEHRTRMGAGYASSVNWQKLAEGREVALRENKHMIVDFAVPRGCGRCEFLQENVYNRPAIVDKINGQFVPVWVDLSGELTVEEKALGQKYDYRNDCLLLFLSPEGEVIEAPGGKKMCYVDEVDPEVFMEYLDRMSGS